MKPTILDVTLITALLVFSLSPLFVGGNGNKQLKIIAETSTFIFPLKDGTYDLHEKTGEDIIMEISGERVRFTSADCPDQVCVRTGWIARCGEAVICVPNRVAAQLICEEGAVDAVSQ